MLRMEPFYADVMFGLISIFFLFRFIWTNYFCSYSFITKWFVFVYPFLGGTRRNNKSHIHAHSGIAWAMCSRTLYMNKYIHCMLWSIRTKEFYENGVEKSTSKRNGNSVFLFRYYFPERWCYVGSVCAMVSCTLPLLRFAWVLLFSLDDDFFPYCFRISHSRADFHCKRKTL